jgi:hypothetical protein
MSTTLARKPSKEGKTDDVEQLKQALRQLLKQYLEGKLDIVQVSEKIVDLLYPWETHYAPLLAYHRDPWAERAADILAVSDMIQTCENLVVDENPDESDEEVVHKEVIQCVLDYMFPPPLS